jgi:23S rRNA (cytidine1920-2'-O)/16S rRNA (cytidine1409-2'-O)-methyltransferase
MILAGNVLVNEEPIQKAGERVGPDANIRLREPELKYVSRGALKLKAALENFAVDPAGRVALDVGASTGGFTEVLLEKGASRVLTLDVGTNQLAWKIRSDPRVVVREQYNARNFRKEDFNDPATLLVMDVSFISIRLILPAVVQGLLPGSDLVVLYKPQFELGKEWIGAGGIVMDQAVAQEHLRETLNWAIQIGLQPKGTMPSPIQGTDGNAEYLIHWVYDTAGVGK